MCWSPTGKREDIPIFDNALGVVGGPRGLVSTALGWKREATSDGERIGQGRDALPRPAGRSPRPSVAPNEVEFKVVGRFFKI